jgi:hypothetical protein
VSFAPNARPSATLRRRVATRLVRACAPAFLSDSTPTSVLCDPRPRSSRRRSCRIPPPRAFCAIRGRGRSGRRSCRIPPPRAFDAVRGRSGSMTGRTWQLMSVARKETGPIGARFVVEARPLLRGWNPTGSLRLVSDAVGLGFARAVSSVGQSASFTPRMSGVRVPHRPPPAPLLRGHRRADRRLSGAGLAADPLIRGHRRVGGWAGQGSPLIRDRGDRRGVGCGPRSRTLGCLRSAARTCGAATGAW